MCFGTILNARLVMQDRFKVHMICQWIRRLPRNWYRIMQHITNHNKSIVLVPVAIWQRAWPHPKTNPPLADLKSHTEKAPNYPIHYTLCTCRLLGRHCYNLTATKNHFPFSNRLSHLYIPSAPGHSRLHKHVKSTHSLPTGNNTHLSNWSIYTKIFFWSLLHS